MFPRCVCIWSRRRQASDSWSSFFSRGTCHLHRGSLHCFLLSRGNCLGTCDHCTDASRSFLCRRHTFGYIPGPSIFQYNPRSQLNRAAGRSTPPQSSFCNMKIGLRTNVWCQKPVAPKGYILVYGLLLRFLGGGGTCVGANVHRRGFHCPEGMLPQAIFWPCLFQLGFFFKYFLSKCMQLFDDFRCCYGSTFSDSVQLTFQELVGKSKDLRIAATALR